MTKHDGVNKKERKEWIKRMREGREFLKMDVVRGVVGQR